MRVVAGLLVSCVLATACSSGDDQSNGSTSSSSSATAAASSLELWPVAATMPVGTSACDSPVPGDTGEYCFSGSDPLMTAADFEGGKSLFDPISNYWVVELHVRPGSTAKWASVLKSETNHQVAMVLDGKVVSSPTLNPGNRLTRQSRSVARSAKLRQTRSRRLPELAPNRRSALPSQLFNVSSRRV
jgi:hypothetical protein